jgi:serine/threonine protein kinase/formylglycine-generating enzyme required for sulfatase activity
MVPDRHLLLAWLALRLHLVTTDQLLGLSAALNEGRGDIPGLLGDVCGLGPRECSFLDDALDVILLRYGGSPSLALAALADEANEVRLLLGLPQDIINPSTMVVGGDAPSIEPSPVPEVPRERRYRVDEEIGRGGLARIHAAKDVHLGRKVAVKEMVRGAEDRKLLQRFLREGRVAGRMMHPNIVPIFDFGVGGQSGEKPYIAMGLITGRNFSEVLRSIAEGHEETCREFSLTRLLQVFQDVCLAVAYAHDQGVIHRDLKPGNIMIGRYGEVYVVDWGLAKVLDEQAGSFAPDSPDHASRETDPPDPEGVNKDASPSLTLDGEVVGTPHYMSPEQAGGRNEEVDERTDIYSLGAILYEILTFRPPYEGVTIVQIVRNVCKAPLVPPSRRIGELAKQKDGSTASFVIPGEVPEELEAIVLRCLAKSPSKRFATARELHREVQRFIEGEKEKQRNLERALDKISEGKELVASLGGLYGNLEELEGTARRKIREVRPHWSAERKRGMWDAQDRVRGCREEISRTFGRAVAAFQEALGFDRGNRSARASLADLYWDRFRRAEEAGDRTEMILYENLVRRYNDGPLDALLAGRGKLSVSTRAYACSCLREGRSFRPGELDVAGTHPFSGRALDGRPDVEGIAGLEPREPLRLRAHAESCTPSPLAGARVWLYRFEEKDRILVPVFPEGIEGGAAADTPPPEVLDALYDPESPFRPGEGLDLGTTPVAAISLPMGSYLLILARGGARPVRVPVRVDRLAEERVEVTLYGLAEIPSGFVQIPAGSFPYQGDRANPHSGPREFRRTGDFFLARFPVTCGEYLVFLNECAAADPEEAARRVPRKAADEGHYWPRDGDGRYALPSAGSGGTDDGARGGHLPLEMTDAPWEEDWPVLSISWKDAMHYAAWVSRKTGVLVSLPPEDHWEKAARGPDGRACPWGDTTDASFCNKSNSHEEGIRPCPVDSFPTDESPYGVRGMAGNSRDRCLGEPGPGYAGWRTCRGGHWTSAGPDIHPTTRTATPEDYVFYVHGARLALFPRIPHRLREVPPRSEGRDGVGDSRMANRE